jgi:hypothetical protein
MFAQPEPLINETIITPTKRIEKIDTARFIATNLGCIN